MSKNTVKLLIKFIVPVVILTYLFMTLDVSALAVNMLRTNLVLFAVSFGLLCLRNVIGAYRSTVLLRYRDLHFSTAALSRYYFIGNFFNLFLPEVVGRDIARGYYLYSESAGKTESISAIVAERFIGTAALIVMSLCSILLAAALGIDVIGNDIIRGITLVFGLFFAASILFFHEKTDRFLKRLLPRIGLAKLRTAVEFIRDIISYSRSSALVWYTFFVSLVFQVVGVVATYLIALSLGNSTPFVYYLIMLPVIWVLGMLPVSINGLGVREGLFVVLFGAVGMARETALAISLLWFVQNIGLGIIGGILFALEGNTLARIRKYREASQDFE